MKLKKILAGTLAATLVMTGVPNAGFTVFAETDVLSDTGASDEGISALAAEDAMPAPYGYQNLQLTVNDNVTVTTNKSSTPVTTNILTNDDGAFFSLDGNTDGRPWMNFHFNTPQTVAGLTYYLTSGQLNGYAKTVKIEIKTSDSSEYKTVYENETAWAKNNNAHTAIFTPVSNVTDVKFHAVTTYYDGAPNHLQIKKMRIMTAPEGAGMVTATAASENTALGTAMADVSDAKAKADTVQVMPGVAVKYQATVANETTGRFAGWQDAQGNIVSRDRVYTTVLEKDTKLTAKFETGTSARINIPLGDNMTWQSANPANIKASSDRAAVNANDMDGRAWYAFDRNSDGAANTNTHWHSDYSNNGATSPGRVRANNPIWIQAGFNEAKNVSKITYQTRKSSADASCCAKKYQILAANMSTPTQTPQDEDFAVVCEGEFKPEKTAQEVDFPVTVKATHIRLKVLSTQTENDFITASNIEMYEFNGGEVKNLIDAPAVAVDSASEGMGTVSRSATKVVEGLNTEVTYTATPKAGSRFVKWVDESGNAIENAGASFAITVNAAENKTYKAVFSPLTEITIPLEGAKTGDKTSTVPNITASNQYTDTDNPNDGPAWYAFDKNDDGTPNTTTHWHTDYHDQNKEEKGEVSSTNPISITAGFNKTANVREVVYRSRQGSDNNCAKDYEIWAANNSDPKAMPAEEEFAYVCSGTLQQSQEDQIIVLPVSVTATHIRLKVLSVHKQSESAYVTASNIAMYASDEDRKDIIDIPSVTVAEECSAMGTVSTSVKKLVDGIDSQVELTATPNTGYKFVKWVDKNGNAIENAGASYTITVNGTTADAYKAVFEHKKINQIALTGKLTENAAVPELTVNAQTTDGETVSNYIITSGTKWTLDGEEISTYPDATKKVTLETVLSALEGFVISDDAAVTVNGKTAALTKQQDGTVKLTVNISSTRKEYTAAGEYTGTDELEFYNDLKKITVTVTGKVKEKANKAYSLFTLEGNNNNYFTVWYNPKNGTMCYTSKDMGTGAFWSGRVGTTDAGKHFKASFSLAQLNDGKFYMMYSVNGKNASIHGTGYVNMTNWDAFGNNFLASHKWNAEKVMIGKKPTGIDKNFGSQGSLSDFDGTISKVVVTNGIYGDSTVPADAANNLIAENNKATEDVKTALQAKATEYGKISAYGYELTGWNALRQLVNDAKAEQFGSDWLILNAMDDMDAAKGSLAKRQITVATAGVHVTCTGAGTYTFGDMVNLSAEPETGYEFKGWKDENGSIVSKDAAYTMLAENNITLTAVCTPVSEANKVTITFKTGDRFSDQICGEPVQAAVGDQITVPAHKDYYGYTFEGWDSNGDGVADITGTQAEADAKYTVTEGVRTLLAVYKIEKETYTVNVTKGTIKGEDSKAANGNYEEGSVVTVTADAAEEGKEFKEWQSDGMVVSTNATYSFIVKKNMNLTAVYADKGSTEVKPVVSFTDCSRKFLTAEDKDQVKMVISWSGVTGCQIVSIGTLRTYDATQATEDNLVLDNSSTAIKNGKYTKISNSGTFTGSLKIGTASKAKTLYARGYITYKDAQGNIHAVYTDIKTIAHPAE